METYLTATEYKAKFKSPKDCFGKASDFHNTMLPDLVNVIKAVDGCKLIFCDSENVDTVGGVNKSDTVCGVKYLLSDSDLIFGAKPSDLLELLITCLENVLLGSVGQFMGTERSFVSCSNVPAFGLHNWQKVTCLAFKFKIQNKNKPLSPQ